MTYKHIPVLKKEVVDYLNIKDGGVYVDCTAGRGGHIEAILATGKKDLTIIGIDKDHDNCKFLEEKFSGANVKVARSDYNAIDDVMAFYKIKKVDGILFDIGFSSIHVDDPTRGFSFLKEGPLDMRYDVTQDLKAENIVNEYSLEELQNIIKEYGEEPFYKSIARAIVESRGKQRITSTLQLQKIISGAIPSKFRRKLNIDPATRTFQAIRIVVNSELESLVEGLDKAIQALGVGGRLCVITFHSLEDRIVKRRIQKGAKPCECPSRLAQCVCGKKPELKLTVRSTVLPNKEEIELNPRSRSAKLRVAEKL